jgi:hypothetical protein
MRYENSSGGIGQQGEEQETVEAMATEATTEVHGVICWIAQHGEEADVRVSLDGDAVETLLTTSRSTWPASWPPRIGDEVTIVPAKVLLVMSSQR